MQPVLVLIDIQRDYFPGGRHPLVGPDAAADAAARVLARQREQGAPVIHVRHESPAGGGFLEVGTDGAEIDARVTPIAGETVVVKHAPNSFLGTDLREHLSALGDPPLLVAGMMTSMCVDATVRAALDLGHDVTVVGDACAAPDLAHDGVDVDGRAVHAAFLAALGGAGAPSRRARTSSARGSERAAASRRAEPSAAWAHPPQLRFFRHPRERSAAPLCRHVGPFEGLTGIEPALSAWEADVLPLNYSPGCREATRPA